MKTLRILILGKWILEDNTAMNNAPERTTFSPCKRYRIYEKQI